MLNYLFIYLYVIFWYFCLFNFIILSKSICFLCFFADSVNHTGCRFCGFVKQLLCLCGCIGSFLLCKGHCFLRFFLLVVILAAAYAAAQYLGSMTT